MPSSQLGLGLGLSFGYSSGGPVPLSYLYANTEVVFSFAGNPTEAMTLNQYSPEAVVFGAGVTSIGAASFYGCSSLSQITWSPTITSIEDYAFMDALLGEITIPDSVVSIGEYVFNNAWCESVTFPAHIDTIPTQTFSGCQYLVSFTGLGVSIISSGAFANSGLVNYNGSIGLITVIGSYAFSGTMIYGWDSEIVQWLDPGCFSYCPNFSYYIDWNAALHTVCYSAFFYSESLTEFYAEAVEVIQDSAFGYTGITEMVWPATLVEVGHDIFEGLSGITITALGDAPMVPAGKEPFYSSTFINIIVPLNSLGWTNPWYGATVVWA